MENLDLQVTTSAAGGMVSARDFIYISRAITRQDGVFIIAGRSVEFQVSTTLNTVLPTSNQMM